MLQLAGEKMKAKTKVIKQRTFKKNCYYDFMDVLAD